MRTLKLIVDDFLLVTFVAACVGLLVAIYNGGCNPQQMQYARTANDAAKLACEAFAQEEAGKQGISVEQAIKTFCGDLRPWLDAILGANKLAAQKAGLAPPNPDGG